MLPSIFKPFLGTNYAPKEVEILQIKELLQDASPELSRMDKEIEETTRALEAMKKKREAFFSSMEDHQALMSPIRRLPLDIFHHIFVLCLPPDHNAVMLSSQYPMLLTHVCQHWRHSALHMPLLWSSIHIPIPHHPTSHTVSCFAGIAPGALPSPWLSDGQRDLLNAEIQNWETKMEERKQLVSSWLERAKGSNLSISIYQWDSSQYPNDYNIPSPINDLITLVRTYAGQWERLEVSAYYSLTSQLLGISASEAPRLRHLTISCGGIPQLGTGPAGTLPSHLQPNGPYPPPPIFSAGTIITSPNLRTLNVKIMPGDILETPIRWANLTELFLFRVYQDTGSGIRRIINSQNASRLLERCPGLRRCGLVIDDDVVQAPGTPSSESNSPLPDVILLHLTHLTLYEVGVQQSLAPFVQSLQLPSLNSILFSTYISSMQRYDSTLLALMRRWGSNIHALKFDYRSLNNAQLRECLELADNVEELSLNIERPLSSELVPRRTTVIPIPHPTKVDHPAHFDDQLIGDMALGLESRGPRLCPRLTSFAVQLFTAELTEQALIKFIIAKRGRLNSKSGLAKLRKLDVQFSVRWPKKLDGTRKLTGSKDDGGEKPIWPFFADLQEVPDIDLEGVRMDIRWPQQGAYSEVSCKPLHGLISQEFGAFP